MQHTHHSRNSSVLLAGLSYVYVHRDRNGGCWCLPSRIISYTSYKLFPRWPSSLVKLHMTKLHNLCRDLADMRQMETRRLLACLPTFFLSPSLAQRFLLDFCTFRPLLPIPHQHRLSLTLTFSDWAPAWPQTTTL